MTAYPCLKKYCQIFVYFKYHNSQWRAAAINFSFSRFFFNNTKIVFMESFKFMGPALLVFWQKMPKIFKFFTWKNICIKMLVVFYHFKKESSVFVQKWAQNKSLLLKTFVSLIFIAEPIVQCCKDLVQRQTHFMFIRPMLDDNWLPRDVHRKISKICTSFRYSWATFQAHFHFHFWYFSAIEKF